MTPAAVDSEDESEVRDMLKKNSSTRSYGTLSTDSSVSASSSPNLEHECEPETGHLRSETARDSRASSANRVHGKCDEDFDLIVVNPPASELLRPKGVLTQEQLLAALVADHTEQINNRALCEIMMLTLGCTHGLVGSFSSASKGPRQLHFLADLAFDMFEDVTVALEAGVISQRALMQTPMHMRADSQQRLLLGAVSAMEKRLETVDRLMPQGMMILTTDEQSVWEMESCLREAFLGLMRLFTLALELCREADVSFGRNTLVTMLNVCARRFVLCLLWSRILPANEVLGFLVSCDRTTKGEYRYIRK